MPRSSTRSTSTGVRWAGSTTRTVGTVPLAAERLKERQVRGEVLHDERRILAPCGPPVVARGLVGIVDFGDPFVDPQRIEEPRVVAAFGRKGETGVLRHVVVAQGEILARGLFALLNGRIEQEGQAVSAIGILAADVQAGPVARPLFAFERAVLPIARWRAAGRAREPSAP